MSAPHRLCSTMVLQRCQQLVIREVFFRRRYERAKADVPAASALLEGSHRRMPHGLTRPIELKLRKVATGPRPQLLFTRPGREEFDEALLQLAPTVSIDRH